MKFAPGTDRSIYGSAIGRGGMTTMQFMDSDKDGVDDRFQRGPGQPREFGKGKNKSPEKTIINRDPVSNSPMLGAMSGAAAGIAGAAGNLTKKKPQGDPAPIAEVDSPATPTPAAPPRRGGGGRRAGRREGRRQAGMNFGLMPTEVIEQTRGRGYGLSYMPQQRTAKQIKFGGGGPQNVINFNPIMSQQANPNIRIGVGGSKQVSRPTQTSSPIQESGPGSVYTGPNTGNFEEGPGGQTQPIFSPPPAPPVLPPPPPPKGGDKPIKTTDPTPEGKGRSKYRKLMNRYMRKFDRTAYGAGSKRGTDRFSGLDIRKMTAAGRRFGGSRKAVAKDVLAYADRYRGKTKMGGTSRKELDKLQAILGKSREASKKRKSKAAKEQRKKERKQSKKASRAKAKAKARAFKSGGRRRGGGKKRGGKRGKRR